MPAYWIKRNQIIDVSESRHIHVIIGNPEQFGLTERFVKATYKKYKEKMYSEGNAREELIKLATQSGWVRVRRYPDYWSIQFDTYRKRKKVIQNFIYWATVTKKIMKKTDSLQLVGFNDGFQETKTVFIFLKDSKMSLRKYAKPIFSEMWGK